MKPPAENVSAMRALTVNDLSQAYHLATDDRVNLMRGILADLRSIEVVSGRDAAGIPHRGASVYREHLEGRSIRELAAAYVELRLLGAQAGVIDAIETAEGTIGEPLSADEQAEYERLYREQIQRQLCPGCGDTDLL